MRDLFLRCFVTPKRAARLVASLAGFLFPALSWGVNKSCEAEVKAKVCWAMCRESGYDTGSYVSTEDVCLCGVRKPWEEFTGVKTTITRLPNGTKVKSYEWPEY